MINGKIKNIGFSIIVTGAMLLTLGSNVNSQTNKSKCKGKYKTECSKKGKCDHKFKTKCTKKDNCKSERKGKSKCNSKSEYKSDCKNHSDKRSECSAACKVSTNKAVAVINPTAGNTVHGIVTFTKVKNGIKVVADIEELTPGKHGFHIHQYGDCSDPKGKSAGGHFNPDKVAHAGHNSKIRHVGDFGNITADKSGKAHIEFVDNLISFCGSHNIIGRGVVIHGGADDLKSQPSGAAGPRVACGSISLAK